MAAVNATIGSPCRHGPETAADPDRAAPGAEGADAGRCAGGRRAVRALVPRMFATMYRAPGIGLAAPQVGVGLRFAVVDLMPDDKRAPIVLVNPEIIAAQRRNWRRARKAACRCLASTPT